MFLYNNRFYKRILNNAKESEKSAFELRGAVITNEERFDRYCNSNAKVSYWLLIIIILFVLYQTIKWVL